MNILVISSAFPENPTTAVHGVYKRLYMFIDAMKEIANLEILYYVPPYIDTSLSNVTRLERFFSSHWGVKIRLYLCPMQKIDFKGNIKKLWYKFGAGSISFFGQPACRGTSGKQQVRAFEDALSNKPDAIFVHKLHSMCPVLLTNKTLPPIYFDIDDIEHMTFIRSIKRLKQWYSKLPLYAQIPLLLSGERRAMRLARKTFVCSDTDQKYVTNHLHLSGAVTIPNAVTIPEEQKLTTEPTLLFMGSYKYTPNIEAAEFLIEKIWPRVYSSMSKARLIIAGYHPENIRFFKSGAPGVTFTGFVRDLEALYQKTRIVCTPIFVASGTRLKIIEAAAYGKAIISTQIGAEGLNYRDSQELIIRNDEESLAEACLQLLKEYSLCQILGANAREKTIQLYDRNNIVRLLQEHLKT